MLQCNKTSFLIPFISLWRIHMQNPFMNQWSDMNKKAIASMQKLADLSSGMVKQLVEQQMEVVNSYVESSSKQARVLSEAKRVQDVVMAQGRFAQELNQKMLHNARVSFEMMVDSKKQYGNWLEDSMKDAQEINPWLKAVQVSA
jgi:phasin family protein